MRDIFCLLSLLLSVVIVPTASLAAGEIDSKDAMPYALDTSFIRAIWNEVIRVANQRSFLKVRKDSNPPQIIYREKPPVGEDQKKLGDFEYWVDEKNGYILFDRPRYVVLYSEAFLDPDLPRLPYGVIAHEFFHEVLLRQVVSPELHHCYIPSRGLTEVLPFIDQHLGKGSGVGPTILVRLNIQCKKDLISIRQPIKVYLPKR